MKPVASIRSVDDDLKRRPTMHILVIRHVEPEGSGAIGEALRSRSIEERLVRIDAGERVPERLDGARGLLVMGGPMGVYEADRFPHLREEMRLIERAVSDGAPVLGVCLGSQLVAAALGARVTRAAQREIGWREVRLLADAQVDTLFAGCPSSFTPLHWHGDVWGLPSGAVPLASSEQTPHQAFRFGVSTWGLLFHMEMRLPQVEAMAATFADDLARAGMRPEDVLGPAAARIAALEPIASRVFGAWADRIKDRGAAPVATAR
jgi:GMP synthase (glutamine-hydrolysing)